MPKGDSLGEFERLVLLAVLHLGEDAYGMRVRREIAERTGRDVAIGAVYATLDRLEEKELLTSELGEPAPERGGRAKKSFRLTAAGVRSINRSCEDLEKMLSGLVFPLPERTR